MAVKYCPECDTTKPLDEFHRDRSKKDGRRGRCRECQASYIRRYRSKNRDAVLAQKRAHYRANRERLVAERREFRARHREYVNARHQDWLRRNPDRREAANIQNKARKRANRSLAPEDLAWVMLIRRDPCAYCDGPGDTWDHIVPVAAGGSSEWDNATGACTRCNASKKDDPLLHFLLRAPGQPPAQPPPAA